MKLKLSAGEALLGVSHYLDAVGRRCTKVWLKLGGYAQQEARAMCLPEDNFCKRTGRKIAATRLLKDIRPFTTKTDRKMVFQSLCPEYRHD